MDTRRGGAAIYGKINETDGRGIEIDSSTHSMQQLTYEHHEIHSGSLFTFMEGFALNGASRSYVIRAPKSSKECHMVIAVSGSQDTAWYLYRNSGYDPGAKCMAYNRNGYSTNLPETEINLATGGAGAPTLVASGRFGIAAASGGRAFGAGGGLSSREEIILNRDYKYAFTVTALSQNANNITVSMDFYEHIRKD